MNKIKYLSAAIVGIASLTACDNVSENERYLELDEAKVARAVLLEEFTGQRCPNCPEGHRFVEDLHSLYGDSVIAVSIHASNLSIPETASANGLATADGEQFYKQAGSPALPAGVVDRATQPLTKDQWAAAVRKDISKFATAAVCITPSVSDGEIKVRVDVASSMPNPDARLQVWITENNIIASQLDGRTNIKEYEHNHVLRAVVSDVSGDPVSLNTETAASREYSVTPKSTWNLANLSIVAFVYDGSGVIHVASKAIPQ